MNNVLLRIGVAVIVMSPLSVHSSDGRSSEDERVVEALLNAPHGLSMMSGGEVGDALRVVLESPKEYIGAFAAAIVPVRSEMHRSEYKNRLMNGVSVLERIGDVESRRVLTERFREVDSIARDANAPKEVKRNAALVRNEIVNAMGRAGSDTIVEDVVSRLNETDVATFHVYMRYLKRVGGGKAGVVERIREAAVQGGKESWPITVQTLDALQKSEALPATTRAVQQESHERYAPSIAESAPVVESVESMPSRDDMHREDEGSTSASGTSWETVLIGCAAVGAGVVLIAVMSVLRWRRK